MNLRFAGMITGCMLVGASAAAYSRLDARPAPSTATLASAPAELPAQAATGAQTSAAWPATSVAFYGEMFEQLPVATAPAAPVQAETSPAAETPATTTPTAAGTRSAPRVIPLPRAPQTQSASNASGAAATPQIPPVRAVNAGAGNQQTPPARATQAPPVRTAAVTTTGGSQTPAGNSNVASGTQTPPAVDPNAGNGGQPTPQRAASAPSRERADMVEVVIRDRYGRPIRVERVERRRVAAARAHLPPPPYRVFHSYPQGPHGGYGPYGLYR